uniref:UBX domain-containing protein n=1 Tax=Steinernema glaseri TaxID=37863 RepID=A0A1I7ZLR6_9BILA
MINDAVAEENVIQFMGITGCTEESEARHYLEACDNDVSNALNLYFAQQSRSTVQTRTRDCINGGASTSRAGDRPSRNNADPDDVRAPIAPVRGPIVEQSFEQTYRSRNAHAAGPDGVFHHFGSDFRAEAEEQYRAMQRRLLGRENEDGEDAARHGEIENRRAEKERSLRDIFQPPYDIMFKGDWEMVRVQADKAGKWLLVNIQDPAEFASQVLNRDVWSNSAIKEIVKGNFLFWQVFRESAEGSRIKTYYKITTFPAIFIIDPRTGELVERLRVTDAISMCDDLTTFLDRFPDFITHDRVQFGYTQAPAAASNGASAANGNNAKETTVASSSGWTDGRAAYENRKRKIESLDHCIEDDPNKPGPSRRAKKQKQTVEKAVEEITDLIKNGHKLTADDSESWKSYIGEASPDTVDLAIVLRMPNGERHSITVPDSTKLKALFAFISGLGYSTTNHILVLSYPKREYSTNESDMTLREIKFSRRELIHVEKKYN